MSCILEEAMPGKSMAQKVIRKVHARLRFLCRKSKHLTPNLSSLLLNALIQPILIMLALHGIKNSQNKYVCFFLKLHEMTLILQVEFETTN